ncbi:DUF6511 domain-containing protein [Consotaella salsifontis]|uniref:Uncharacterized protein n=1 Tax=Consotaella salsifontis TaxID=1365950 RepID=A0A1T4RVX4_9HYPH|nr:DUF6511 domain-containing protein [Consotaella salsifontis]SKA19898.1 hypothetical protein SAMN05428963_1084 [Consotaella salsifontis]
MTFTPTAAKDGTPTVCHVCGMHAVGIGIGKPTGDPRYLCSECLTLLERIREVRRFDPYEMKAREGGMDAAAPLVEEFGADLSEWSEDQVLRFVGTIWRGCADRLHKTLSEGEAPF